MVTIKDKIKIYPRMSIVSDNGFQAIVHTDNYNNGCGGKIKAILIYDNDGYGDGKYGSPVYVIYCIAYDTLTTLNK